MKRNPKALRLFLVSAALTFSMAISAHAAESGTITGGTINIRKGPGTDYARITMLMTGKQVNILGYENGWYHISWNGNEGYVLGDYLVPNVGSGPQEAEPGTVTGGTINVRTGPGTSYDRIARVNTGKRVNILNEENGWYQISFDGKTGYILGEYVTKGEPATIADEPTPTASAETQSVAAASEVVAVEARNGIINGGTINVRTGPGTDYDRIAKLYTGKKVSIIGEANGWFKISFDGTTGYVLDDYVYEGDSLPASASASSVGEKVASMARQYLGTRYVYGGASPSGFDCSGFTLYLYKQFGYSLPHSASAQYASNRKVSKSELQPGDLVFFTSSGYGGRITHVAVYVGGGQIVHARMSVGKVYTNSLSENYYTKNYVGAVRIA